MIAGTRAGVGELGADHQARARGPGAIASCS